MKNVSAIFQKRTEEVLKWLKEIILQDDVLVFGNNDKTFFSKKNIKKAISQNPKILDFLEKNIYPILKSELDLLLKDSEHLLIMIEVPLLFEKDFRVNFLYRSINVFCTKPIHRKRLNLRFGQSKSNVKNILLKRHYSQEKKSIFSDEIINSGCNNRLKKLLIEVLLSKYLIL